MATITEEQAKEAIEILTLLFNNKHISLGDKIYDVRDSEGKGWEGKSVTEWSNAVERGINLLKELKL